MTVTITSDSDLNTTGQSYFQSLINSQEFQDLASGLFTDIVLSQVPEPSVSILTPASIILSDGTTEELQVELRANVEGVPDLIQYASAGAGVILAAAELTPPAMLGLAVAGLTAFQSGGLGGVVGLSFSGMTISLVDDLALQNTNQILGAYRAMVGLPKVTDNDKGLLFSPSSNAPAQLLMEYDSLTVDERIELNFTQNPASTGNLVTDEEAAKEITNGVFDAIPFGSGATSGSNSNIRKIRTKNDSGSVDNTAQIHTGGDNSAYSRMRAAGTVFTDSNGNTVTERDFTNQDGSQGKAILVPDENGTGGTGSTGNKDNDETLTPSGSSLLSRSVNSRTGNAIETWVNSSGTRSASLGIDIQPSLTSFSSSVYIGGQLVGTVGFGTDSLQEYESRSGRRSFNDPIALDLDGDGVIQRLNKDEVDIFFGNGANTNFAMDIGWVGSGEGLLAYDFNGDGLITDTSELLENGAVGAIQNLKDNYDSNADNVLDANDTEFANFRIWQDVNTNGITDAGELMTLAAAGVASINLSPTSAQQRDENGHRILGTHSFTRTDATTGIAEEFYFDVDGANSRYVGDFDVKLETLFLSQAKGYGLLPNLHIAASQDETLLQQVRDITNFDVANMANFKDAVRDLVLRWSGADQQPTYLEAAGTAANYQTIYAMYKLSGIEPGLTSGFYYAPTTAEIAEETFNQILDRYTAIFAIQGPLSGIFNDAFVDLVTDTVDFGTADFAAALATAQTAAPADVTEATSFWAQFANIGRTFATELNTTANNATQAAYNELVSLGVTDAASLVLPANAAGSDIIFGASTADVIDAGTGNDVIFGGTGDDDIDGGAGDDIILAGDGFDDVTGGEGNDIIDGGNGNSFLGGQEGDDLIIGHGGVDNLDGGEGADTILAGANIDNLYGGAGDDNLQGESGADTLYGGADDDTLYGGDGDDTLFGDKENATSSSAPVGNDTLYGGNGNDTINAEDGDDTIYGGLGDDTINTGTGNDDIHFAAGDGQDLVQFATKNAGDVTRLVMGSGIYAPDLDIKFNGTNVVVSIIGTTDQISLQTANSAADLAIDEIIFDNGSSLTKAEIFAQATLLDGTSGNDVISGSPLDDTINGGDGDDYLYGNDGNDTVTGGDGVDYIEGGAGNDYIDGGLASDIIYGNDGNDTLLGRHGSDYLSGGSGDDFISGENDNDTITGGAGADRLFGGDGNDTIYADYDDIDVDGGAGTDTVIYNGTTDFTVDIGDLNAENLTTGSGNDTITTANADGHTIINAGDGDDVINAFNTFSHTVYADGGNGNDTVTGGGGDDVLFGGNGNDTLNGLNGNDYISAGSGDDQIMGSWGNDTYIGGSGTDTLTFTGGFDFDVDTNLGTISSGYGQSSISQIEVFETGNGADTFTANAYANNTFNASNGTDTVSYETVANDLTADLNAGTATTSQKTDTLISVENITGGTGNDTLTGDANANVLIGGAGNDTLTGGDGADELIGGTGDDDIIADADDTVLQGGDGYDTLTYNETTNLNVNLESAGFEEIHGGDGNDLISFGDANVAVLSGGAGSDTLTSGSADTTFIGGAGNDKIYTGTGNDIIKFGIGDGIDTVYYNAGNVGDVRKLELDAGITPADVTFSRVGGNIKVAIAGVSDAVYLATANNFSDLAVDEVVFNDGTTLLATDVIGEALSIHGTSGADFVYGSSYNNERLYGYEGNDSLYGYAGNDTLYGGDDTDKLYAGDGDDHLLGGNGNDTLYGDGDNTSVPTSNIGNDILEGGAGNDVMYGHDGDDTFIGGTENDHIFAGKGNDTIYFNLGDGNDTIYHSAKDAGQMTRVILGAGILPADLKVNFNMNDIEVRINGNTSDWLKLRTTNNATEHSVGELEFDDGTIWTHNDIMTMALNIEGTSGQDTLRGSAQADTISGYGDIDTLEGRDGNDTIHGGDGNDTLRGGNDDDTLNGDDGADKLYGDAGNDTLTGSLGKDTLYGGAGDDTYQFSRGDYEDTIYETSGSDTLSFLGNVDHDQLWFSQVGQDLKISVVGTLDSVKIDDWYASSNDVVETITSGDGYTLDSTDVAQLVQAMAAFNPPAMGQTEIDQTTLDQLAPTLASTWQQAGV